MKVTATYSNGRTVEVTNVSSFQSSDPTVALPDRGGLVRAAKPGNVRVTAAFGKFTGAASIVVSP
jgi:hypothetical protein